MFNILLTGASGFIGSNILNKIKLEIDLDNEFNNWLLDTTFNEGDIVYVQKKNNSYVIGITGPPGAGKSTLTNRLIQNYRKKNFVAGLYYKGKDRR